MISDFNNEINIIVAICNKNGIGRNNKIPWLIKDDLKHFKLITTNNIKNNNIVIMGRNTWESLPSKFRPLSDRYNFVISSKKKFLDSDNVEHISSSFLNALEYIKLENIKFANSKIFIIGGQMLYNDILNNYHSYITNIFITEIYSNYTCDTFFPDLNSDYFKLNKTK